ncbi:MFS transporter [Breoghania corrubedonensis]|uniref:MFS transporter n=1 Tax=Breoghania corrubedonensis TaxID=665038 RepID=A0A2T5V6L8_9HYPH|nr:MFS transporter [Breoghania corrubedonensis]PTW59390.1 MFS transporter [Breoghania corrubedonensis]
MADNEPELRSPTQPAAAAASPQPAAAAPPPPPHSTGLVVTYMAVGVLVAVTQGLGMSLVSVNLRQLAGEYGATTNEAIWLLAIYMAPNVSLTLLLLKLRSQFGLRRFAEIAIIIFVITSLVQLWATDLQTALVVRFCSGVAASPMSSLAILYILDGLPRERKLTVGLPVALTAMVAGTPIAGLISPTLLNLGGAEALFMFEAGLALVALGMIIRLPLLTPTLTFNPLNLLDLVTYAFLAVGLGSLAIVTVTGRYYWWFEAPWIGALIALAIVCLAVAAVIELNRKEPLVDVRWLSSKEIVHFTGSLLLFRLLLSEQSTGTRQFFSQLGLLNEQISGFYWVVLVSGAASGFVCSRLIQPGKVAGIHLLSLTLLAIGTGLDSQATAQTRPEQMYFSQMLVGFASGLFLPPAMAFGFIAALKRGPNYLLSFVIVFLTTQRLGALFGSAVFGTFVTWREQFHSAHLVSRLVPSDPLVAARIGQLAASYKSVLTDAVQLKAEGSVLLAAQVQKQAYVLAYTDAFFVTSVIATIAVIVLVLYLAWRALLDMVRPVQAES